MIDAATLKAITTTAIAWLAARQVSPVARAILAERLEMLTRPHAMDLSRQDAAPPQLRIARAALWLSRADRAEADRDLEQAIFDVFLDRSEDAVLAAPLTPVELMALGIWPDPKAA